MCHRPIPRNGQGLARASIALGVFLSAFVLVEPAPYDLFMAVLVGGWFLAGLRIGRAAAILLALLVCFNVGGLFSLTRLDVLDIDRSLYMAASLFLGLSSVFFASVVAADAERLKTIFHAYVVGALATALLGILGYFGLFGDGRLFTLYSRASGAFQDPNVFGPYLVLPACYLIYRLLTGGARAAPVQAAVLLALTLAVFLSFSRAAWGLYGLSALLIVLLTAVKERSAQIQLRILLTGLSILAALALALLAALQFQQVSDMFTIRAKLVQDYDSGAFGRFERYRIGFAMAMENPLGIGPLAFGRIFGADPHNIWLKALLGYGWLGLIALLTLVVWTLAAGFRLLLRARPWQPFALCAYVVFAGHLGIATVIDIDHWRHFYILLGILWGCIELERTARPGHRRARVARPCANTGSKGRTGVIAWRVRRQGNGRAAISGCRRQ